MLISKENCFMAAFPFNSRNDLFQLAVKDLELCISINHQQPTKIPIFTVLENVVKEIKATHMI